MAKWIDLGEGLLNLDTGTWINVMEIPVLLTGERAIYCIMAGMATIARFNNLSDANKALNKIAELIGRENIVGGIEFDGEMPKSEVLGMFGLGGGQGQEPKPTQDDFLKRAADLGVAP